MKKKILAILLCFIISLNITPPAFAALPENLTERTNEYSVIIKSGDGLVKVNKDETVKNYTNSYDGYSIDYIDAEANDFINTDNVKLSVREGETIKNRLNYEKEMGGSTFDVYTWQNEAFITNTRVAHSILQNGLSTQIYNSPRESSDTTKYELLAGNISGLFYPRNCTKAYLFLPPSDELVFSHFIDQHGNIVSLNEPVTENLFLTPIYTIKSETNREKFFGKEIYQVTILPGEGRLQKYTGDADSTDKNNVSAEAKDENYIDLEQLTFAVEVGDTKLLDISNPYARLIYSDLERSDKVLKDGKTEILYYIDSGNSDQAVQAFNNLAKKADSIWFTTTLTMNLDKAEGFEKYELIRENGCSLMFILMMWTELVGEDFISMEEFSYLMTKINSYDTLTQEEKDDLLPRMKKMIESVSNSWDLFINQEYLNISRYYDFETNVNNKGYIQDEYIYEPFPLDEWYRPTTVANCAGTIRLRTPDENIEDTRYVFSHFVDQDGNIFKFGDPVNRDLILTPIYYDRWDPLVSTNGSIFVTTEDNSDESFSVSVNRGSMGFFWANSGDNIIYDTFINHVQSLFTEEEMASLVNNPKRLVELFNARSYFKINEGCVTVYTDEEGTEWIGSFLLPLEYLNSKSSYTFDESLWTIDENGQITDYSGDIGLIGIPESINGITVTSIAATAFANLSDKYIKDPYHSANKENENVRKYYENYCAIWLPKSIENLETGITSGLTEKLKAEYINSVESEEEKALADCLYATTEGTDDCTAFTYLPASYVVVDSDNLNYSSVNGFLYDKNQTELLYVPFIARTELDARWSTIDRIEDGLELPITVNVVSAFANWVAYNQSQYPIFGSTISAIHSRNVDITFNSYYSTLNIDGSALYDRLGAATIEQLFGVTTKEELISIMEEQGPLFTADAFFWSSTGCQEILLITPKSETETNVIKSIREYIEKSYLRTYPEINQEELNVYVNDFLQQYIIKSNSMVGKINRNGLVSADSPYSLTFLKNDEYIYSVSLNNIPERYKPVDIQTIIPSCEGGRNVTFNLELKKGNILVVSKSLKDTSLFLNATYQIIDSNGNIIADISSLSDGTKAVFNDLSYGEYTIVQTEVENGYAIASSQTFSITEDGQLIELEFLNDKSSIYSVRVPKKIILNGNDGTANVTVSVKGNILPTGKISILPAAPLTLHEQASVDKKNDVISSISPTQTEWTSDDISLDAWSDAVWHIQAPITAGIWQGVLPIIIKIE